MNRLLIAPLLALTVLCCARAQTLTVPVTAGQTWQVAGHAPAGWVSTTVPITSIESGTGNTSDLRFVPDEEAFLDMGSLASRMGHRTHPTGVLSFDTRDGELQFVWEQGSPLTEYACVVRRPDPQASELAGELRVNDRVVGTCTARQGTEPVAAPANLPTHPLASSGLLGRGQAWRVTGQGGVNPTTTVRVEKIQSDQAGRFSNSEQSLLVDVLDLLDKFGLSTASSPYTSSYLQRLRNLLTDSLFIHDKLNGTLRGVWNQGGVVYVCEVNTPDNAAERLQGQLLVNLRPLGSCTIDRLTGAAATQPHVPPAPLSTGQVWLVNVRGTPQTIPALLTLPDGTLSTLSAADAQRATDDRSGSFVQYVPARDILRFMWITSTGVNICEIERASAGQFELIGQLNINGYYGGLCSAHLK